LYLWLIRAGGEDQQLEPDQTQQVITPRPGWPNRGSVKELATTVVPGSQACRRIPYVLTAVQTRLTKSKVITLLSRRHRINIQS
jgi:hypothetical protein